MCGGGRRGASSRTLNRLAVRQPHDRAQTHELARLIYGRHECRRAGRREAGRENSSWTSSNKPSTAAIGKNSPLLSLSPLSVV